MGASVPRLPRQFTWVSSHLQGSLVFRMVTESLRWMEERSFRSVKGNCKGVTGRFEAHIFPFRIIKTSQQHLLLQLIALSHLLTMDVKRLYTVLGGRRNFLRCCCLAVMISIGTFVVATPLPEYYSCQCLMKGYLILYSF